MEKSRPLLMFTSALFSLFLVALVTNQDAYSDTSSRMTSSTASYLEHNAFVDKDFGSLNTLANAADLGDPQAAYWLGRYMHDRLTLSGSASVITENYKNQIHYYRIAAKHGDVRAQLALASLYAAGHGGPVDYKQASIWYKKAAQSGSAEGEFKLGMMYANGQGIQSNLTKAMGLLQRSAAQGYSFSQTEIGLGYKEANNYSKAALWFGKAADGAPQDLKAVLQLSELYLKGEGVPKNSVVAWSLAQYAIQSEAEKDLPINPNTLEQRKLLSEVDKKANKLEYAVNPSLTYKQTQQAQDLVGNFKGSSENHITGSISYYLENAASSSRQGSFQQGAEVTPGSSTDICATCGFLGLGISNQQWFYIAAALTSLAALAVMLYGWSTKCPKCNEWFAAKLESRDLIDQSTGYETVRRTDVTKDREGTVISKTYRDEQVRMTYSQYRNYHVCKKCQHTWSTIESEKNEG